MDIALYEKCSRDNAEKIRKLVHEYANSHTTYELSNFRIFHSNAHSYCISLHSSHRICHYYLVCMMHSLASISSRVVFVALIVCYSLFSSGDGTRGCHVEVEADRRQRDSLRHRCRRIAVADPPTHPLAISSRRTDGRTEAGPVVPSLYTALC